VVNSGAQDYYPTLTRTGTLYFSSNRQGGLGENDIYRARRVDGRWTPPENLGRGVNSEFREFDPFIAPDESYVIFASTRPGGLGGSDLYISFRNARGEWDEPKNMGPSVNSAASDYTPILCPDGRYLFFTSSREGQDDIFWIDSRVVAALRPSSKLTSKR
jgi:Tol biopolymer transport system component